MRLNDTIKPDIIEHFKSKPIEQDEWKEDPVKSKYIKKRINQQVKQLFVLLEKKREQRSFDDIEKAVVPFIFTLGRMFFAYFL